MRPQCFATAPRLTQRSVLLRPGLVPFFTASQLANGVLLLNCIGFPGRTYTVQAASDLANPQWSSIGSLTIPSFLGIGQFTDTPVAASRFYRLTYP